MPWGEVFFRVVTELGSDYFYMILIAVGFWAVDKRASRLTVFVLTASVVSNYWLKITFKSPRPPATNWLPGVRASNYSLPSGHAQNSTTLWGWLGIKIKTRWMAIFSAFLAVLIGLSRIYLGVHWLGDVLIGWILGLILLIVMWKLEKPIQSFFSKFNPYLLYLGLVLFGLATMILTEMISPVTIVGMEDNFGVNGGLIIGLGIGLPLERKYVNFKIAPNGEKWRAIMRIVIGLILIFGTTLALSPLLPTEIYWLRATRYAFSAVMFTFMWPFLFKKFNL